MDQVSFQNVGSVARVMDPLYMMKHAKQTELALLLFADWRLPIFFLFRLIANTETTSLMWRP